MMTADFIRKSFAVALLLCTTAIRAQTSIPERCPAQELPDGFDFANPVASLSKLKDAPRLFHALGKSRRAQLIEALKKESPNVCMSGMSLLSLSASAGDPDEVRLLLNAGADPNRPVNDGGSSPLALALSMGRYAVAKLLLEHGANSRYASDGGLSALHDLVIAAPVKRDGSHSDEALRTDVAEALLAKGADLEARGPKGATPLMLAATAGDRELVAYLLYKGANPAAQDQSGNTAISRAIKRGDKLMQSMLELEPYKRLLRADKTAEFVKLLDGCKGPGYPDRATGLVFSAVMRRNAEAVAALAKCGADVNERGTVAHNGKSLSATPFGYAAVILGDLPLAKALLQAGGDVNRTINSVDGEVRFFPLTMALSMHRFEVAHYLIEHGANLEAADPRFGNTPLIEAIAASNKLSRHGQDEMLALARKLLGSGAKINARNALDMTALHFAASAGNVPAIQLLLSHGADPLALDNRRHSPLFYAKQAKANEAIKLLEQSRQPSGQRKFP